jgi:hypothetical protein
MPCGWAAYGSGYAGTDGATPVGAWTGSIGGNSVATIGGAGLASLRSMSDSEPPGTAPDV